jgi:tripartite-type tricarboxylate transporter receptor subunit TctC
MKTGLIALLAFLITFCSLIEVQAAEVRFPTKPIDVYVGFTPGGGTDLGARLIAEKAKAYLGQDIVVVNKPGGAGITAATLISEAKPDGYLLGATTDSPYTFLSIFEKLPFNNLDDFTFLCQYGILQFGLIVRDESPFRDLKDILQYARENPEKLTIGTIGMNAEPTMAVVAALQQENVKVKWVPFQGASDAMTAVLGGHVMVGDVGVSGWAQHYRAKKIRVLVMFGDTRSDDYPDIPCLKEMGYPFSFSSMYVFVGPKNMDKSVRDKIEDAFFKSTQTPEWENLTKKLNLWTKSPMLHGDKLTEALTQKYKKFSELVKKLGLTQVK